MSAHMPKGSEFQQAAAWELLVASIILASLILYRFSKRNIFHAEGIRSFKGLGSLIKENSIWHTILYIVLFVLVFSAMLSFFIE